MFSLVGPPHVPTQDVVSQNSNCKLITQGNYHFNTATHTNLALVHCILLHPRTALSPYPFWDHVSNGKYLLPWKQSGHAHCPEVDGVLRRDNFINTARSAQCACVWRKKPCCICSIDVNMKKDPFWKKKLWAEGSVNLIIPNMLQFPLVYSC